MTEKFFFFAFARTHAADGVAGVAAFGERGEGVDVAEAVVGEFEGTGGGEEEVGGF